MGVLKALVPYLDEIMAVFYREILSHEQMAVFFKDDEHIKQLITQVSEFKKPTYPV